MSLRSEKVIDCLVHRLQVLHVEELDEECQPLMLVQVAERRLPRHGETLGEGLNAGREIGNLVLAHVAFVFELCLSNRWQSYEIISEPRRLALHFYYIWGEYAP